MKKISADEWETHLQLTPIVLGPYKKKKQIPIEFLPILVYGPVIAFVLIMSWVL